MDTQDIENILGSDIIFRLIDICIVVARDHLASIIDQTKTAVFVINTEPSHRPGEHLVALYYNGVGKREYFISFSLPGRRT